MEKLAHSQYYIYLETNNLIQNDQCGFRKNRSTSDAINNYLSFTMESLNDNKFTMPLSLTLLNTVKQTGVERVEYKCLNLTDRTVPNLLPFIIIFLAI